MSRLAFVKTATAGFRIAKAGAAATGGSSPSNRSPVSGNSADVRRAAMHFGADVMGNQAHDPLSVGGRNHFIRLGQTCRQGDRPNPAIWVQHHFDDIGSCRNRLMAGPSAVRSMREMRARPAVSLSEAAILSPFRSGMIKGGIGGRCNKYFEHS